MRFSHNAALVIGVALCAVTLPTSAITLTPTSSATGKATPTPTMTVTPSGPVLIAIDNLSATDTLTFSTDFDAFSRGTVAEDLNVQGITFTSDPPGIWEIQPAAATFQSGLRTRFQTLTGNVLIQLSTPGTLTITFASPVSSFSCTFAEDQPPGASSLIVQAYRDTTLVRSTSFLTNRGDVFGEGAVNLVSSTRFDTVRLSSIFGTPSPTPTATPHLPSLNPGGSPPAVGPDGALPLGGGGNGCSIGDAGARVLAYPLGAVLLLIVCVRRSIPILVRITATSRVG